MRRTVPTAALLAAALSILPLSPAGAHETRKVGAYTFVVGFGTEPAFANVPNSAQVTMTKAGERPVVDGVELEVEIIFGEESITLAVEPNFVVDVFGEPGNYGADFFPTRPGTYSFRFFGSVEGTEVDETFTSSEETFSDVLDPGEAAFPAADPSNAELAQRLDRETRRVAEDSEAAAGGARTLAFAGIGVGVLGSILGGLALARSRKRG